MRITFSLDRAVVVGTTGDMNIAMPKERNFKMEKDWYYYRINPTRETMGISGMPLVKTPTGELH